MGLNTGTPVTEDYQNPFSFNGKIARVTIDLLDDKENADAKAAIGRQESDGDLKRKISD